MAPLAVIPRFARWSNRRDYSSVVEFCKWQGANTDDTLQEYILELADNLCLPNQGVRIVKAVDWLEFCQRLFPVRDEMVAGTLVVVIVGIVVDRALHTVYACECPQGVRVHLFAAFTRLVVASLGVYYFDSATCDRSRHRQIRGHLQCAHPDDLTVVVHAVSSTVHKQSSFNVFEGNLVAHVALEVMGGAEDSALDQTRSIVADDRNFYETAPFSSLTSGVSGTATTIRRSPRAHAPPQLCLILRMRCRIGGAAVVTRTRAVAWCCHC